MSRVLIQSFLRSDDGFEPMKQVQRYGGDCRYVPGAISLVVDGVDLLGVELWDDVNWLWPFVVQALSECRQTGAGRRGFPDQPITFKAEVAWAGTVLLSVTDGEDLDRKVVAPADELYDSVARAGLEFFADLQRLCPNNDMGLEEREVLETWLV